MIDGGRVRNGAVAATVAAVAGVVGLAAVLLFFAVGQPFGTISDVAGLVMIGALGPVMLAHYELGGLVPLWPSRASLAGAMLALAGWAVLQVAFILGILNVDTDAPAAGGWQIQAVLQVIIGLWIAGASLLAGRWLLPLVRTLGILAGIGVGVMAFGIARGGYGDVLTNLGGVGYQIVLPIWAWLLSRVFRGSIATPAASGTGGSAEGTVAS